MKRLTVSCTNSNCRIEDKIFLIRNGILDLSDTDNVKEITNYIDSHYGIKVLKVQDWNSSTGVVEVKKEEPIKDEISESVVVEEEKPIKPVRSTSKENKEPKEAN